MKGEVFKNAETLGKLPSSAAAAARYVVDEALMIWGIWVVKTPRCELMKFRVLALAKGRWDNLCQA